MVLKNRTSGKRRSPHVGSCREAFRRERAANRVALQYPASAPDPTELESCKHRAASLGPDIPEPHL